MKEGESNFEQNSQEDSVKSDVWSPEKYLKRTAFRDKAVTEEVVEKSLSRLNVSLPEKTIESSEDEDFIVEVDAGDIKYNYSYSEAPKAAKSGITKYIEDRATGLQENPWKKNLIGNPNSWLKLDSLVFETGEIKKDVFASLPKNTEIFFYPAIDYFHGGMFWSHSENDSKYSIYIIGDMNCPRSIVTLMHEIGHIFDAENQRSGKESPLKEKQGIYHYDTAEKIRKERAASAFALKVMKPFLKDKQLGEDVINFLEGYALSSYNCNAVEVFEQDEVSKPAREKESRRMAGEQETEERELEEYSLYEDFLNWKKTDAYKQWKEKENNKNLEDDDDYGVWRLWLEETNYDYHPDLINKSKNE